jgi:hypothetical protein
MDGLRLGNPITPFAARNAEPKNIGIKSEVI